MYPRRWAAFASTALLIAVIAGCGDNNTWVDAAPAEGWPAEYADAANSSYTAKAGATELELRWSRSVKGSLFASVALGSPSYLAVNAQTAGGCSLMVWEYDNNGRQRWCARLMQGGGFASALVDRFDNVYVGEPGTILSFPPTQWVRWRHPVIGMPQTPRFLGGGNLLMVTHLGQVQVLDAHRGTVVGPPLDLVLGIDPTDSFQGLSDCQSAKAGCPVAAAPAFSASTNMIVLGLWRPGAQAPILLGVRYQPGATHTADHAMGKRRRHFRRPGQPGVRRRRQHGVRQQSRRQAVGAACRRRTSEMVSSAGLFTVNPAVGGP